MKRKVVVTISREYGSGGREVGRLLAEKLKIPFYDKELLTYLAKESGIDEQLFKEVNEKISFANFYFGGSDYRVGHGVLGDLGTLGLHERIQKVQEKLIRQLAQESCVIIGRCAEYILRDDPYVVRLFIRADLVDKKRRAVKEYGEAVERINDILLEMDTRRANFYHYFTDRLWGKASNYDMVLSTSHLSLEKAADVICSLLENREVE